MVVVWHAGVRRSSARRRGTDETFEAVWRSLFAFVAPGNRLSGQSGFSPRVDRSDYRHGTEKLLMQVPLDEQTHEYDCWHLVEDVEMKSPRDAQRDKLKQRGKKQSTVVLALSKS